MVCRQCGGCTLCCTYLNVETSDGKSVWKEPWTKCRYSTGHRCTIYSERPAPCSKFECLWIQSNLVPKIFRPDKVRAVLSESEEHNAVIIHCLESDKQHILDGETAFARYVTAISKKGPVAIATNKGIEAIGIFASRMNITQG